MATKLEGEVETKSSAEKVYEVISAQQHHLPNACSDKIHDVAVHDGAWHTSGSVKLWKYTVDGTVEEFKEKMETDEANKTISLTALEGHVLDLYKSYKIIFQRFPMNERGLVKITLEYEKQNENVPAPTNYLNFLVHCIKDIDAHLLKP
ncbi:Major latex protein domain containing protein [Trema orientale]|uniref:Major latex protein domain containing protein n=1 Tax=Trema orientale TaxID=63057 RepID=A0A2P5D0B1_TREOI|nr:Major latex protein domain containing protein [Trema orientale]